jgi:hypothetical protein
MKLCAEDDAMLTREQNRMIAFDDITKPWGSSVVLSFTH